MQVEHVLRVAQQALAEEPEQVRTTVLRRLERHWADLVDGLRLPYGDVAEELAVRVVGLALQGFRTRPTAMRGLDLEREAEPDWFQSPRMLGYACYADRFAGDLRGVADKTPYLAELGVTYLHLLPLLRPRPGDSDGGYAVMDYRSVREDLGTVDDLSALASTLRQRGISLAVDLVLNHVAREHEWARRARAGEQRYRDFFHVFPDRRGPDAFEATLPEVFPETAPGSFTWDDELAAWVWTTFNAWQWDLNWHNHEVFCELLEVVLFLANTGVEVLRLDAIAFLWKREGTDCQDQPEVHALTQALRAAVRIAAPAVLFKAEAIVGPERLVPYLGVGQRAGKVSDLAYHNGLMVHLWSSLAARDVRLMVTALRRFPARPTTTAWGTYVRCHDDIGWAIGDEDAAAVGWDGQSHRRFLSDYYTGAFPGSDARGLVFQENPLTGDRRVSGSAASLAGLSAALEDGSPERIDLAVRRLVVLHLAVLAFGGVPLLWMGDELGLLDDPDWAAEPQHEADNRWAHRPRMPWDVAARRSEEGTVEHRIFCALRDAVRARAGQPSMRGDVDPTVLDPVDPAVLGLLRSGPGGPLVALHNLADRDALWPRSAVPITGELVDVLTGEVELDDVLRLPPYSARWLVARAG